LIITFLTCGKKAKRWIGRDLGREEKVAFNPLRERNARNKTTLLYKVMLSENEPRRS